MHLLLNLVSKSARKGRRKRSKVEVSGSARKKKGCNKDDECEEKAKGRLQLCLDGA